MKKFIMISFLIGVIILVIYFLFPKFISLKKSQNLNLIIISVDTLRPDHMGIYGYKKNTTPNIDKWAENATVFTNAYTNFPLTMQSFYSLFTGTRDFVKNEASSFIYISGDYKKHKDKINTLTTILRKNNFYTTAIVTNPVLGLIIDFFKTGFNEFYYVDKSNSHKFLMLIY